MELLQAFLLGLLQGITEFLPVSSSGHLALARAFLGRDAMPGITFEIVVHFGSFCSIAVYYRRKLTAMTIDIFQSFSPEGVRSKRFLTDYHTRFAYVILLSMIPAMIVGFTLKDTVEAFFMNPFFVSGMLIITGTMLFSTKFVGRPEKDVNAWRGIIMGVAQSLAILPGISRSGSTITVGLFSGISRVNVANFSFLMVLPVLAGAMLLELMEILEKGMDTDAVLFLVVGFTTSFISGYFALKYLIMLLKKEKFHYFAYYCWALGLFGLIFFF